MAATKYANNLEVQINEPLDTKLVCNQLSELPTDYLYVGLLTYCKNDAKYYKLTGFNSDKTPIWEELIDDVDLSGYKQKQTSVSDPTADGSGVTFIATITQNENGVITATKKSIDLSSKADKDHTHVSSNITDSIVNGTGITNDSTGLVEGKAVYEYVSSAITNIEGEIVELDNLITSETQNRITAFTELNESIIEAQTEAKKHSVVSGGTNITVTTGTTNTGGVKYTISTNDNVLVKSDRVELTTQTIGDSEYGIEVTSSAITDGGKKYTITNKNLASKFEVQSAQTAADKAQKDATSALTQIDTILNSTGHTAAIDTLKDVIDWIGTESGNTAANIVSDIQTLKNVTSGYTEVSAIKNEITGITATLTELSDEVNENEKVTAESLVVLNDKIDSVKEEMKPLYQEITYLELVGLRDNSELIPGTKYRITDYVTTTSQENTQSAGHQFDIIVTADGTNSLSEVARSCFHDGDNYFSGVNLGAWELRYCLNNDINRFAWTDPENGKGVIYYMKDEFGNEAPYDFKNIKFIYNSDFLTENANWKSAVLGQFTGTQLSFYTFSYYNTQSGVVDDSLKVQSNHYAHGNKINNYFRNEDGKLTLNNIVFVATENSPYNNIIENSCHDCIFGDNCYENTIGFNASSNVVGNKFYNNKIGSGFKNNKIYNTNKNSCFYSNILGNNCQNNIFPRQFYSCECGDNFINNDFFTNSSAPTASYVKNCSFGNNFEGNTGIHYKLSNIEILNNTLTDKGNWNDIIVDNGKTINKCLSDYDTLGYFKLFIGLDENDRVFLRDFNEQSVYHMGHFTNIQLALRHAATVEIAGNETLSKICFTTGTEIDNSPEALNEENHTGYIEQYVSRNISTQVIFWQSGFRIRKITFTDNNRTAINDDATTDSIKKGEGEGVYWSNPTSLYYDQASHKIALNRFDDGQKWGLSGCFGEVEIPLASNSIAGLMSVSDKLLLTNTSTLLNKFVKSKAYNSLPNYVGGDWYSHKRYWYRFARINDKSPNIFRISTNAANDVIFTSSIGWSNGSNYDVTGALSVINSSLNSNENHACIEGVRLVASSSGGYIDMLLNTPYSNGNGYVEIYVTCISTIFNNNDYEPLYNNIEKLEEKGAAFERNGETIVQSFELVDKAIMSKDFILTNENGEQISVADSIFKNKNITYSDLKELRDNNKLIPGQKYQITDYVTTTVQDNTISAGHQFDIIVEALTENVLSEDAKAVIGNDEYFDESNLEAWELKYCLDNDSERFAWADTTNGTGVIYYMKDEFNNEVWYDFKNIQFLRTSQWFNEHPATTYTTTSAITQDTYFYTFSKIQNGEVVDDSLSKHTVNNKLGKGNNYQLRLDNTILIGDGPFNNIIGNGHENNTLGKGFSYNNIGCNFRDNIINTGFQYNTVDFYMHNNQLYGSFMHCDIKEGFSYNMCEHGSLIKYCEFGGNMYYVSPLPTMSKVIFESDSFQGSSSNPINLDMTTDTGENLLSLITNDERTNELIVYKSINGYGAYDKSLINKKLNANIKDIKDLATIIEEDEKVISQTIANLQDIILENEEVVATDLNNLNSELNSIDSKFTSELNSIDSKFTSEINSVNNRIDELVTEIEWGESSNMNNYTTAGIYELYGERRSKSDNLPITNSNPGHSVSGRLVVIDSSLRPTDGSAPTEICITQFLQLSNREGGDGASYVRTYNKNNGNDSGSGTWSVWQKQQGMVETYINTDTVTLNLDNTINTSYFGLNSMIDNGMYSGIYVNEEYLAGYNPTFLETFALIVINDYAATSVVNGMRTVTQLKYSTNALNPGTSTAKIRVGVGNSSISWGEWVGIAMDTDINRIDSKFTSEINSVEESITVLSNNLADLTAAIEESEEITAGALNKLKLDINGNLEKIYNVESDLRKSNEKLTLDIQECKEDIILDIRDIEETVANSLVDLNKRLKRVEEVTDIYEASANEASTFALRSTPSLSNYLESNNNVHLSAMITAEFDLLFNINNSEIFEMQLENLHYYARKDNLTGIEEYRILHNDGLMDVTFTKKNNGLYDNIKGFVHADMCLDFKLASAEYEIAEVMNVEYLTVGSNDGYKRYFTQECHSDKPNMHYISGNQITTLY